MKFWPVLAQINQYIVNSNRVIGFNECTTPSHRELNVFTASVKIRLVTPIDDNLELALVYRETVQIARDVILDSRELNRASVYRSIKFRDYFADI